MAKYDKQLERMQFLMGYDNTLTESKKNSKNIEYHTTGADGKEYGIIKEGTCYFIKESDSKGATLLESYNYIGGFTNKNANRYHSYNEATKQLELKLMGLNETYGKKDNVIIADLHKNEKAMNVLTEAARGELDRMHQIFENSFISKDNIGNHGDSEKKGSSTGANTIKNNAPFEEKATATLDKDPKTNGTVEGATPDNDKVKEPKMDDTSMRKGGKAQNDFKDTHDDLDGEGVADKKAKGGKVVKMNESMFEDDALVGMGDDESPDWDEEAAADDAFVGGDEMEDNEDFIEPDELGGMEDGNLDFADDMDNDPFGEEDLESLLEEFMADSGEPEQIEEDETQTAKQGNEETMKSYQSKGNGDNNVHGEKTMDKMDESEEVHVEGAGESEDKIVGPDKVMDGPHGTGNSVKGEDTMDKMNESIERITNKIVESLCGKKEVKKETCPECGCEKGKCKCGKKKETLQEAIDRIVAEEITRLDAYGKHPRFRKAPMTIPANKEVTVNAGDKDWNHDSVKGETPYASKIGSSAPFDEVVSAIADNALATLKESLKKKH